MRCGLIQADIILLIFCVFFGRGSTDISVKGQRVKTLGSAGHMVSVSPTQLSSTKVAREHVKNECSDDPINL